MAWNLDFWFNFGGGGPGFSFGRGGDINSFLGGIARRGVARKSRYRVTISPPTGLAMTGMGRLFEGRCEAVTFPGQNIRSVPDTLRYGPEREHPQGMTYGPISATFICDKHLRERGFFAIWQQMTVNKTTWEPKYYNETIGEMEIYQLDERNRDTYGVKLFEVFPKNVGPIDVGHAQGNTYQTVTVEFTFHHWKEIVEKSDGSTGNWADPAREKIAPLEQTKHGFMARNYKSSSIIRNPHADR